MPNHPVLLGVIGRAHGVRGLVRVTSHTADPAALTGYGPLSDPSGRLFTLRWMGEGIAEISRIVDGKPVPVADRLAAEQLTNTQLFVERDRLPAPEDDEYYLTDLIGLTAADTDAVPIGIVSAVHDYGAGASLEIARDNAGSLLVPFTAASVPEVDIAAGRVIIIPPDDVDVPETVDAGVRTVHSPDSARHKPALTRHDPATTRHDPAMTRHDPAMTRADPALARHNPTSAQPDPTSAHPDPEPTRPGPEATRPGPEATRPGTEATRPGTNAKRHGPARPGHLIHGNVVAGHADGGKAEATA